MSSCTICRSSTEFLTIFLIGCNWPLSARQAMVYRLGFDRKQLLELYTEQKSGCWWNPYPVRDAHEITSTHCPLRELNDRVNSRAFLPHNAALFPVISLIQNIWEGFYLIKAMDEYWKARLLWGMQGRKWIRKSYWTIDSDRIFGSCLDLITDQMV